MASNDDSDKKVVPSLITFAEFDAKTDAEGLRNATADPDKIDVEAIISILTKRSYKQRASIILAYSMLYNEELVDMLRSHLYGHLELLVEALLTEPIAFLAMELHRELKLTESKDKRFIDSPDESTLIEILVTIDPKERMNLENHYRTIFKKQLDKDLGKNVIEYKFQNLLNRLLTGDRSSTQSATEAIVAAQMLVDGSFDEWVTVFTDYTGAQLSLIAGEYYDETRKTIYDGITDRFSGKIEKALLDLVNFAEDSAEYFAVKLMRASGNCASLETSSDEHSIMRIVVSRHEIDFQWIKDKFELLYKDTTLRQFIEKYTSGHHKTALISLLKL